MPAPFRPGRAAHALLLPTWLVLGIFFLLPLGGMLVLSFGQRGLYGGVQPVADWGAYLRSGAFLGNYTRSLAGIYLKIGWRSLWMAVLTTVLCLVLSYPAAYCLALVAPRRCVGRGRPSGQRSCRRGRRRCG